MMVGFSQHQPVLLPPLPLLFLLPLPPPPPHLLLLPPPPLTPPHLQLWL